LPDSSEDFFGHYTIDKILTSRQKNSASSTVILFGRHNATDRPVAVKLFIEFDPTDDVEEDRFNTEEYNKFMYESGVYRGIGGHGLANVVRWISTESIPFIKFREVAGIKLRKAVKQICGGQRPKNIILIITERRPKAKILNLDKVPQKYKKNILYQILFTLAQMQTLGYQHNDLRLGNILLDKAPAESAIFYNGRRLPIKYKALLFDWDLAYCTECGINHVLEKEYCPDYGMCNVTNHRFDMYTLLRAYHIPDDPAYASFKKDAGIPETIIPVYDYNGPEGNYRKIPNPVIPVNSLTQAWEDRMCNYDVLNQKCLPFPPGEPAQVKTPLELINHPYFN
jgi:serine/threonine protein kinase